jgi:hypothetical protein
METLSLAVTLVVGVLAGAIVALKAIAPKTKTLADDKVLARLEALEALLTKLLPGQSEDKAAPEKKPE